ANVAPRTRRQLIHVASPSRARIPESTAPTRASRKRTSGRIEHAEMDGRYETIPIRNDARVGSPSTAHRNEEGGRRSICVDGSLREVRWSARTRRGTHPMPFLVLVPLLFPFSSSLSPFPPLLFPRTRRPAARPDSLVRRGCAHIQRIERAGCVLGHTRGAGRRARCGLRHARGAARRVSTSRPRLATCELRCRGVLARWS
ncbi:hypothetical protein DFH06DRAFT_1439830, partial [Mycena polygramma]